MARRKPKVTLLVTSTTPMVRMRELQARLARSFKLPDREVEVRMVDGTCQVPSSLAAMYGGYLYADPSVSAVAPDSLELARDWGENWALRRDDLPGRSSPLYYCKLRPRRRS